MDLVLGNYQLVKEIPSSTPNCQRYMASQHPLGRAVEVAVYSFEDEKQLANAVKAATLFGSISHPNLESLLDFGTDGLKLILVREAYEGEFFTSWLAHSAPLKQWQVEQLFLQIVQGVGELQKHKMLNQLSIRQIFMAKTSDGHHMLKTLNALGLNTPMSMDQVVTALGTIALILVRGGLRESIETLEELSLNYKNNNDKWLKLVYEWAQGTNIPKDCDELVNLVTEASSTLQHRRDTWTLGTTTNFVAPPTRKVWPVVLGACLGVAAMVGVFLFPKGQESYNGPLQSIKLASTAPYSGTNKEIGLSYSQGVKVALLEYADGPFLVDVNVETLDDGYKATKAKSNLVSLLKDPEVIGLFGVAGTGAANEAYSQVVNGKQIIMGSFSGDDNLRDPEGKKPIFNYHPSHSQELTVLLNHLIKEEGVNPQKIAVFYQNGLMGQQNLAIVNKLLVGYGVENPDKNLLKVSYRPNYVNVTEATEALLAKKGDIEAVLLLATHEVAGALVASLKKHDFYPKFGAISSIDSSDLEEVLREYRNDKLDITITQAVPDFRGNSAIAKAYQAAMSKYGNDNEMESLSFEGYIVTQLLIKALTIGAKTPLDSASLAKAIEKVSMEVGEGRCQFSPTNHDCLNTVWISKIDTSGRVHWLKNISL